MDAKKRKTVYNPTDVNENGESTILAQYDEEIDGKKRHRFTLDGFGSTQEQTTSAKADAIAKSKGDLVTLDSLLEGTPISDYKDISEIKIKKPKKKKSKTARKKFEDDDIFPVNNSMEVNASTTTSTATKSKKRSLDDATFEDDEDLQAQLARQRREALKMRKKMRPEDLAKQIREDDAAEMDGIMDSIEGEDGGLVIDETTEFVETLRAQDDEEAEEATARRKRRQSSKESSHTPAGEPDADGDTAMESYANVEEVEEAAERAKREESSVAADVPTTGVDEEQTLNRGLGAALNMLKQRNLVDASVGASSDSYINKQEFLANQLKRAEDAQHKALLQREKDRESGRLDRMTAREREEYARQSNTQRELTEAREAIAMFNKEYRPNVSFLRKKKRFALTQLQVELKYQDEDGRQLTQKEAFKHLSHMFHGKGSGKQKHEKRLKKIEEEKKRMAASAFDASQSSASMPEKRKQRQAGVRLQ